MKILAIDTTGFSASIALVKDGNEVIFNKIKSGFKPANWWKFPYLLPSFHQEFILENIKGINWKEIDAIAVSANSGIYTCILAGTSIAKTLSKVYQKPLIEVDHLLAHIYSNFIENDLRDSGYPILVFSASGSHGDFALIKNKKECEIIYGAVPKEKKEGIEIFIGLGKIFYQIGRELGIITPKDEGVSKLMKAASLGNPDKFDFTKYYKGKLLDLNFLDFMESIKKFLKKKKLFQKDINDISASFQNSVMEIVANKIIILAKRNKVKEIHLTGGISNDFCLQKIMEEKAKEYVLRYPKKKEYRLDNAAMIGSLACYQRKYKIKFKNFEPNVTK